MGSICNLSLDDAVQRFRQEFVEVAIGDNLVVEYIAAEYVASSEYNGTWNIISCLGL